MTARAFIFLGLFHYLLGTDLGIETKFRENQLDQKHVLSLARAKSTIDAVFDTKQTTKEVSELHAEKKRLFRHCSSQEHFLDYPKHLHILQYGTDLSSIKEAICLELNQMCPWPQDYASSFTAPHDLERMLCLKAESIHRHNAAYEKELKRNHIGSGHANVVKSDEETDEINQARTISRAFRRMFENRCWFCRCEILPDQLRIETNFFVKSAQFPSPCHALCGSGFQGYKCSYYPIDAFKGANYTPFEWQLIKVFERTNRFVDLNSDFLKNELNLKAYDFRLRRSMKNINPDVAYWKDYNGQEWAIHRKWFGKPEDVKWEQYIVELLKKNIMMPTKQIEQIFKKETMEQKMRYSVPIRVIDFIEKCTQCASFEEAVKKNIPVVKFIDFNGERFMRLLLKTETIPDKNHRKSFVSCDSTPKNPNNDFDSLEDAIFEELSRYEAQKRDYCVNQTERGQCRK